MHTILIVDDNDDLRMVMLHMLKNFNTLEAKNGKEALEIYHKHKPDFVFMDILMPIKDGISTTKDILQAYPDAIIIAITAYSSRAKEIIAAGAKEALIKPVRSETLTNKIEEYLD